MPTTWTDVDPFTYIATLPAKRQGDAERLLELFEQVTGQKARMYGPSIIGFGEYQYEYESGHSGFAPAASLPSAPPASWSIYRWPTTETN